MADVLPKYSLEFHRNKEFVIIGYCIEGYSEEFS
jgi:hypothetical protein